MDPSLHLSTCVDNRVGPSKMVAGVVSATISPTPNSKWKEKYSLKRISTVVSEFSSTFDNVGTLYRLPWILAIVGG